MKMMKRIISLLICVTLVIGYFPVVTFAEDAIAESALTEPTESVEETDSMEPEEKAAPIHEHEYTAVVTNPTCSEQGYTTYTCDCGDTNVDDYVDATGEHSYENSICTICSSEQPDPEENLWEGRSAVFVGDSITAGSGTTKIYYQYLEEIFDFGSVAPMGVAGSCISAASDYGQSNQPLINRYQNIPSADLIVVFMGTNDYGHETPLGVMGDSQDGSFYGALNTIIPALVAKHPSSKILFVTPLHRYGFGTSTILGTKFTSDDVANGVGATLGDYVDALKTVCANNDVSVIDLYTECTLDPADAETRMNYMPDGLHLNAAGHEVIAGIMEPYIRGFDPAEQEPVELTEMVHGNRFASGNNQTCRASSRINYYLKAGTVITLRDSASMQWACTKTSNETSSNNLGYFPDSAWSDKETAVVSSDGWIGFVFKYRDETRVFDLTKPLSDYITIEEPGVSKPLSLRYDDHYDVAGKTAEILDCGTPTSYQVGYGVEENKVLDTAVVTMEGNTLVATGIGTATVKIDGETYEITVTAAPISLLLLIGQSNMEGNEGEAMQSIVCPDGMVYATYGDRYDMVLENATHYAPSALTGEYRTVNTVGGTDGLCDYPVYMLTDEGDGRKGPDSGFAYEWVKQTGEKVWIVNAAHGGTSLDVWQPGTTQYEECQAMFGACKETLRKEIAAGHFTLSHMAYFWCQGCNDYNKTAEWYVDKYLSMHESLNAEMCFDHDGDTATPVKQFEFAGIIPVRAGHSWSSGYRAGTYTDSTNKSSYESFVDLQMTGPRVAQYWMCNNPELDDIVLVCNIGEDWVWMPDGTNGVSAYFNAHYPNGTVDYTTQVQQSASWYKPTTPNAVHDSIHYNQIGYNEVGRESVRNALIYLGINPDYEEETTVKFVDWTGYQEVNTIEAATAGSSGTLAVPIISPVTRSKTVDFTFSEGLSYEYYDLLANSVNMLGQLQAVGTENCVTVTPRSLDSYTWNFNGTNLVNDPAEGDMNNSLTLLGGSITDGLFSSIRYKISRSICLNYDSEWGVELRISYWSATVGSMIFSGGSAATSGQPYVYFRPTDFFVGFGYYDGTQYNNYGVSLKNYGIACNEGTHTYCFVNRIAADGTNAIWLYVDGEEIAPLTEYYVNSTLTDANSNGLSGKDFVLSYIGTSDFAIKGCVIDGIRVVETGYDPGIHLHTWSGWETKLLPSSKGPGIEERICTECGNSQSREVEGVWQQYDLDDHMVDLPDEYCAETNLWPMLPHDAEYYHSGVRWDINGNVRSVTFAVNGGEQIFATSFGKRGTNGAPSSDGIRLTFFGEEGVLKTTAPQETYAEFNANGGYIIVPEGAIAVNVPMYNNSDANELYILNRNHNYGKVITASTCTERGYTTYTCVCGDQYVDDYVETANHVFSNGICTNCGTIAFPGGEPVLVLPSADINNENSVWIDGKECLVIQEGIYSIIHLPSNDPKTMTTYTYGESNGKRYPVGMKVWILSDTDGIYTATRVEELDDALLYAGCSIRVTGTQGIRMITSVDKLDKKALTGNSLAGYTLKEYGTAIAWAGQLGSNRPLVLGKSYVNSNYAYKKCEADPIYDDDGGRIYYTNVIVGFTMKQCIKDLAMRPYMILEDADGNEVTLYGGIVERSIQYIASEILGMDLYKPDDPEYEYLQTIMEGSATTN